MSKDNNQSQETEVPSFDFVDLMPVDFADPDKSYSKALEFALESKRIKNIALTGPYGSGKSSIIKTFEKNNKSKYSFLNISLASFKDDESVTSKEEFQALLIERSILQQMLYGSDANSLPYSRFKRISTPRKPYLKSLFLVFWIVSAYAFFKNIDVLSSFSFDAIYWWLLFTFGILLMFTGAAIVSEIYKATFGISLKKISLKNAEIETSDQAEDSILNKHLDEIIYFFQMTNYNVVIIEDLDRFGNSEIFVKLREINKLINDSAYTTKTVKFLYAVKDDMFYHKSRVKFFDFIIPVVPVVNRSNSLDKIQERLTNLSLVEKIDNQFLRGISLHINDLRLIHNICNEFLIYYNHVKSENLDVTKLFAMMVYKNVYPSDFEGLHHERGVFYQTVKNKLSKIQETKENINSSIDALELKIKNSTDEKALSSKELIDSYIGRIASHSGGQPVIGVVCGNEHIPFNDLSNIERFQLLIKEDNIRLAKNASVNQQYQVPINKSFQQLESEINPNETFLSRIENINNRQDEKVKAFQKEISLLKKESLNLPHLSLSQLLQGGNLEMEGEGIKNSSLLGYLIKNGYLDESYYLYISNFHEGRLTKDDRYFLITIFNLEQPDPTQPIDNPKEICENMRIADFGQHYVLNVILIDYLLEAGNDYLVHINKAFQYIAENYDKSARLVDAYLISGKKVELFIQKLCKVWPKFSAEAVNSKQAPEIISCILRFVDKDFLVSKMNEDKVISDYIEKNANFVFCSNVQAPDEYDVLKGLNIKVLSLEAIEDNKELAEYLYEENLYSINSENINYVLQKYFEQSLSNVNDPINANYTSINAAGSDSFIAYVNDNLVSYINKVFLTLPDNSKESEAIIIELLKNNNLDEELKIKIISKQDIIFSDINNIPDDLYKYALKKGKIDISWKNISSYLKSQDEDEDENFIVSYIQDDNNFKKLSNKKISIIDLGEENAKFLSKFLLNADAIDNSKYCCLIKCLPYYYKSLPTTVSKEKLLCLAKERTVRLTESSFEEAGEDNQLMSILIIKNIDTYLADKDSFPINDEVRELLLISDIDNNNKIEVCTDVTTTGALGSYSLLLAMTFVFLLDGYSCSKTDDEVLKQAIIKNPNIDISIRLLVKCLINWSRSTVMNVIAELPSPYNQIAQLGKRPKLKITNLNKELSNSLKTKGFISSVKENKSHIRINTKRA